MDKLSFLNLMETEGYTIKLILIRGEEMMLKEAFFSKLYELVETIENSQEQAILEVSKTISNAMADGHCIHIFDTGHLLDSELINRAGGLYAFQRLRVNFQVENPVRTREEEKHKDKKMEGLMSYALRQSHALPGDVLIVGSVSGKSVFPVDIALSAKEMGLTVIAMTSVAYSSLLKSEHSTGKRLFEVANLVIDNCAPPLDAMVEVDELGLSICPASGIAAAIIMWAIEAKVTENLLERGIKPTILKSINFPGSAEHNEKEYKRYDETGN